MKTIISTEKAPKAVGPYSQAVEANGFIYLSGQIPIDPATGKLVEANITCQTHQVLKNMGQVLEASGCTYAQVVKTTCFLTDLSLFGEMNAVYATYFTDAPPARATVQVSALPLGAMVEIEAVAVK